MVLIDPRFTSCERMYTTDSSLSLEIIFAGSCKRRQKVSLGLHCDETLTLAIECTLGKTKNNEGDPILCFA